MIDTVNTGCAVGAVASPWWLPYLHDTSAVAAMILPVLGVVWLSWQMIERYHKYKRGG